LRDGIIGNGKIIDVLILCAIETTAKQKPRIVVDEGYPGFVYRAELFGVLYSARIGGSPFDRLVQRLLVTLLDVSNNGKF